MIHPLPRSIQRELQASSHSSEGATGTASKVTAVVLTLLGSILSFLFLPAEMALCASGALITLVSLFYCPRSRSDSAIPITHHVAHHYTAPSVAIPLHHHVAPLSRPAAIPLHHHVAPLSLPAASPLHHHVAPLSRPAASPLYYQAQPLPRPLGHQEGPRIVPGGGHRDAPAGRATVLPQSNSGSARSNVSVGRGHQGKYS